MQSQQTWQIITLALIFYSVTAQDQDKNCIRVRDSSNGNGDEAFMLKNPLYGLTTGKFSFYSMWIRANVYDFELDKTSEVADFHQYSPNLRIQITAASAIGPPIVTLKITTDNTAQSSYFDTPLQDGKWNLIWVGFSTVNKIVYGNINNNPKSVDTGLDFYYETWIQFFQYLYMSSKSKFINMAELQFWLLTQTEVNNINFFYERYQGISFKKATSYPSQLIEFIPTVPDNNNFPLVGKKTSKNFRSDSDSSKVEWRDCGSNVPLCSPSYRFDLVTQQCRSCNTPCSECSYQSSSKCMACLSGYEYYNYACSNQDCPKGTYYNFTRSACMTCESPCSTCKSYSQCKYCLANFLYVEDGSYTCVPKGDGCPDNTYLDPKGMPICRSCPAECASCLNQTYCMSCVPNYFLSQGQCNQYQCFSGDFYNSSISSCQSCPTNCSHCNALNECTRCMPGSFLDLTKKTCEQNCSKGYYADIGSNVCMQCQPDCTECVGQNYTCTACNSQTFLFNQSCVERCPLMGYFHNQTTRKCDPCDPKCILCADNATDCPMCYDPFLLHQRTCLKNCPAQTYNASNNICYPCHAACSACKNSLIKNCTACNSGFYLLGKTCLSACPSPYYQDSTLRECILCKYFCDSCSSKTNCVQCKPGYPAITNNCTGGYYFKASPSQQLALPLNTNQMPANSDINRTSVEIWLRSSNVSSADMEVIIGLSPYKLRKTAKQASIHLSYRGGLIYCDTLDAKKEVVTNQWHHYAWTINEAKKEFFCYLDGEAIDIGSNSALLISKLIDTPTEITIGGTTDPKLGEINFSGYLHEFRFWNVARSAFDINYDRFFDMSSKKSMFLAYWKLNEINDGTVTKFQDSSNNGPSFDPSSIDATQTVQTLVEFKELTLLICPQSYYATFDSSKGYYECNPCNDGCKNCKGPTASDCVECYEPKKLFQSNFTCQIVESCPTGTFQDPESGLCMSCNSTCYSCSGSPNFCSKCNQGFFREYKGTGCVYSCPAGMYGNFEKQVCLLNPSISYLSPSNETVFLYGTFVDLIADYQMLNSEGPGTFSIGWKIIRKEGMVDISKDAYKPYYQTPITKVHLDNNIIQSNAYYYISFFVQGSNIYYRGLYSELTHYIYFGSPPKNGKCNVSPIIGISTITKFQFKQLYWIDEVGIDTQQFFYSMDDGSTFLPMTSTEMTASSLNYTFNPTYQKFTNVKIKCLVTNLMGFTNQATTAISLESRSSADAVQDLTKLNPNLYQDETSILLQVLQLRLITQYLGQIPYQDLYYFDPKITPLQCKRSLCNNKGNCSYQAYTKKYYCLCEDGYGGQNCTFSNETQLEMIQDKIYQLSFIYSTLLDKTYDFEFMKIVTSFKEQLRDDSFSIIVSVLKYKMQEWRGPQTDNDLQEYLLIISNLLEYLEHDLIKNNVTLSWQNSTYRRDQAQQNLYDAIESFLTIKDNSLIQVDQITTSKQFTSRMLTFKQIMLTQESLITVSASNYNRTRERTMIKVAPKIFSNTSVPIEQFYILETVEYAINPYQIDNMDNIATNIFEATIYNSSNHLKASVSDLENMFEFFYPYNDNQNLSEFMTVYNSLSPYKSAQNLKRQMMLNSSSLSCVYWDQDDAKWISDGCVFLGLDNTHIKCGCNHLTAVAPTFLTPTGDSANGPVQVNNNYTQVDNTDQGEITVQDLQVPLDQYFKNLQELLQHKQPKLTDFLLKPGLYVVVIFWAMYISSLIYYTGRDHKRRYDMTKSQNRLDLAEVKDDGIQCLEEVINDLILRDFEKKKSTTLNNTTLVDERRDQQNLLNKISSDNIVAEEFSSSLTKSKKKNGKVPRKSSALVPEATIIEELDNDGQDQQRVDHVVLRQYSEMTPEEQKVYRQRARKKVFGKVGTLDQRINMFYKKANKKHHLSDKKMQFFYEALKTSLWLGLISTTSKISPRHTRLALLYLYISIHLTVTSIAYILGYFQMLIDIIQEQMFSMAIAAIATLMVPWIVGIPVALIFRMPHSLKKKVEGVKTKKINKIFKEIDRQMGIRYAFAYFICYSSYLIMTVVVLFFNYFYPRDYCMNWLFLMVVIYFLDLAGFTIGFAGFQLTLSLLTDKVKCFYHIWALFEKIRRIKNLRG